MDRSIDSKMRQMEARSVAFERLRQDLLEQIVSWMAQLGGRRRPLPRLMQRAEDLATLAWHGMLNGPLWQNSNEDVPRSVRQVARVGFERSSYITPLFDAAWYKRQQPELPAGKSNPALHYARHGFAEPYDPSPLFANSWYSRHHPAIADYQVSPILHYRLLGAASGQDPHPVFDTKWYLEQCTEAMPADMTPLEHFLVHGWKEGKDPGPWFQTTWYRDRYAPEGLSEPNPVIDYLTTGAAQGRDPSPLFSTEWYRRQSPDLASTGHNPLFDFLAYGRAEGRQPLPSPTHISVGRNDDRQPDIDISTDRRPADPISHLPLWPKSVLVVTDKVTATQEISFGKPLAALVGGGEMTLEMLGDKKDWTAAEVSSLLDSIDPDILVLSRYTLPRSELFVSAARERDIPALFHIDDDLLDVPESLGKGKQTYRDPERLTALRNAMNSSDLVYTSTQPLAERLVAHGIQAPILHGDLYCTIDPDAISMTLPATRPVIGYMGTSGHGEDLASIGLAIENLLDSIPVLSFETFGTISPLPQLARFGDRVLHHSPVPNYTGFLEKLRDLGWWMGLAPLADNPFNRCKADTKWVEYTYAGVAVVAQDLPLYRRACADGAGILATGEVEWGAAITKLLRNPEGREEMVRAAQEKLRTVYCHEALCRQVLDVFKRARALHARNRPVMRARR